MTFDELFQSYVDYGFTKPVTPITYGTGITSLPVANQIATPSVSDIQTNERDDRVATTVSPTSPTTGKMSFSDIATAIGFAINPAMGIANLATQKMTGKSIAENIMDAIGNMRGTPTPVSETYGYTGGSGDTGSAPGAGDPNASMGDTGMATGGDGGGVGSSSDAGAGSTGSCGSFKYGGFVDKSAMVKR